MKKSKSSILLVTCLLSLAMSSVANAQESFSGHRIGGGFSATSLSDGSYDYGTGIKLEYGYDINRIIGINVSYEKNSDTYNAYYSSVELDGFTFKVTSDIGYAFNFSKWSLKPYGTAGIAKYSEEGVIRSGSTSFDTEFDETNVVVGVGVRATFDLGLYVDLRSEYIPVTDMELSQGSVTVGYKF
ncbi:porin family protein [Vibrio parahaemolyticus]|uniref:porin family protein n=1 Tax=Vibrio parahaemolyticus TaxID=670 RepID=UPI003133C515